MKFEALNAQDVVIIANGTEDNYSIPFETFRVKSSSQTIYLSEEIGKTDGGTIDKISFYVSQHNSVTGRSIKVYLRNTTDDYFVRTGKFTNIVMTNDDLVFDGMVDLNSVGWCTITLENGFNYDGTNLLVSVFDYTNSQAKDTYFYQHNSTYNENYFRTITIFGGNSDPTMSGQSYANRSISPNIQISFVASTPSAPTAPDAPTIVSPENGATDVFNPALNFTLGANTEAYQIMMGEGTSPMTAVTSWIEKTSNTVSYQTSNLIPNTTYSWKVVARSSDGGTGYLTTESETYSFTTKNVTTAPGNISNINPADGMEVDINPQLSWTFGENTESYKVLFAKEGEELSVVKEWTLTNNATSATFNTSEIYLHGIWENPGLDANSTYNWQIVTKNQIGETSSDIFSFTKIGAPDNVSPINPANGATDVTNTVLSWRFDGNATHYRVLMDFGDGFEYVDGNTWLEVNSETASFDATSKLIANTTYRWCVDVKNEAGARAMFGGDEAVATFSFTTSDKAPAKYTAPANNEVLTSQTATLEWNYGAGNVVTEYQVLLSTDNKNWEVAKDWTARGFEGTGMETSGSYTTEALDPNTKYYWQVNVRKDSIKLRGDVWSFVSELSVPQNVSASSLNVYPTTIESYKTATTTVMWNDAEASGYNVYVDGKKYNEELVTTNYCLVSGLTYNVEEGHAIKVAAYYEGLGESAQSEAVNVKVGGWGSADIYVKDENNAPIAGATITLAGVNEFGEEDNTTFTTNDDGYNGGRIHAGDYTMIVEKDGYILYEETVQIVNGGKETKNVTLLSEFFFNVRLHNVTLKTIELYLENENWLDWGIPVGYYDVYLKQGDEVSGPVSLYFQIIQENVASIKNESAYNDTWAALHNGTYQIGIAVKDSEIINWSEEIIRDYNIFEVSGDITEKSNWRDGLPEATEDIYIINNVAATLASGMEVTYKDVRIEAGSSLTINGKLTANMVYNNAAVANLCINDGGQLIQNNENLNGKFVMNIVKPNNWGDNKDGWQFISSPIEGVFISKFFPNNGGYDLYKYDGTKDLEWINEKSETDFDSEFEQGRAYLASYELAETAAFTGTFNSATSHVWELSYDAEKPLANFHLLGNPFTFDMDVTAATFTNLVNGVAVVNNEGSYVYSQTTIPVGDGFFVQALEPSNATDVISLSYGVRGARSEKSNSLNITATGKAGKDNVVINFAGKSEGFNKLQNFNDAIATVYVSEDGKNYGIYNCDADVQEVELNFNANKMGNYTISIEPNGKFETVTLVDRFTGDETNMLVEDYTFTAMSNDNHNRFIVRMVNGQQSTVNSHFVYQSGEDLILNIQGDVQIVDVLGRVVYNGEAKNDINRINVSSFNSGAYMVKVMKGNEVKVEKVVIY